jgi:archaeal type IV pilus assembly protein PilA
MTGSKHAEAVSPVVGVMLMLAVTVMIAAVVSAYAGGFSGDTEKSPQSSIRAVPDLDHHRIYFEHNGGDPFMLSSINVVLRENDNKTSLSLTDAWGGRVKGFSEVGSTVAGNDTTIKAGDTFYIEGQDSDCHTCLLFGSQNLTPDQKITWLIVNRESGTTISTGSFYL